MTQSGRGEAPGLLLPLPAFCPATTGPVHSVAMVLGFSYFLATSHGGENISVIFVSGLTLKSAPLAMAALYVFFADSKRQLFACHRIFNMRTCGTQ